MTQAPTPGPLSAQNEEAIAFNLCSLHGFDPAFVNTQRDFALAVIKEYERARPSLAPTAPVEASGSGREDEEFFAPFEAFRPKPSGETREAVAAILNEARYDTKQARELSELTDAILALGGQQGEGAAWKEAVLKACENAGMMSDDFTWGGDKTGWGCVYEFIGALARGRFVSPLREDTTPARAEAQDEGAAGEIVGHIRGIDDVLVVDWAQNVMPPAGTTLYAHPSPTPAADADRVRIEAVKALEPFAKHAASYAGMPDDYEPCNRLVGSAGLISNVTMRDFRNAAAVFAALKSTAAKEGGAK